MKLANDSILLIPNFVILRILNIVSHQTFYFRNVCLNVSFQILPMPCFRRRLSIKFLYASCSSSSIPGTCRVHCNLKGQLLLFLLTDHALGEPDYDDKLACIIRKLISILMLINCIIIDNRMTASVV
jgi:hypothetical protein